MYTWRYVVIYLDRDTDIYTYIYICVYVYIYSQFLTIRAVAWAPKTPPPRRPGPGGGGRAYPQTAYPQTPLPCTPVVPPSTSKSRFFFFSRFLRGSRGSQKGFRSPENFL